MANTYSQMLVQIVFAVKGRNNLIQPSWEDDLQRYITGIVRNKGQRLIAINGMPDHVHILIGMRPNCRISDLVRDIKTSTNSFVNSNRYVIGKFEWQTGYGVFTYHNLMMNTLIDYIRNQKTHHRQIRFKDEYRQLLNEFKIEFEEKYLFNWLD